jgi:predicted amidohydrolase
MNEEPEKGIPSETDHPGPRKVMVATTLHPTQDFCGQEQRICEVEGIVDQAAEQAGQMYPGEGLDLIVLPEEIMTGDSSERSPAERALRIDGPEMGRMRNKAREHQTYIVVPLTLVANDQPEVIFNSAALLDRSGETVGVYHKVHPVADSDHDTLEGGITPGSSFPVFDCDFGKLGIQICWDMSYGNGWLELAKQGAEIVALPTASAQTVRPASYALRGQYYVISSTPKRNASIFNPIGRISKQITDPGIMVYQIDLSHAIVHWSSTLDEGRSFTKKYGDQVDYIYYQDEDTGLFWSNDAAVPIRQMVEELGEVEMSQHIQRSGRIEIAARENSLSES